MTEHHSIGKRSNCIICNMTLDVRIKPTQPFPPGQEVYLDYWNTQPMIINGQAEAIEAVCPSCGLKYDANVV